ncbi:hypothetical protein [Ktedonospora formicarum]|uniref:Uncharacterized protein n=1 Tax=Ktedonospora formicarum TaxID=2778364 RepID=A0A8J3I339_9CHLR|nr:hypothetical protein [Ktedonospora formicarum]GHO47886.1 hypothetical protein KSX_60490 [Ktedonospora formicarum]
MTRQMLHLEGENQPRVLDVVPQGAGAYLSHNGERVDLSVRTVRFRQGLWARFSDTEGWVSVDPGVGFEEKRPVGRRWFYVTRIGNLLHVNGTGTSAYLLTTEGDQIVFNPDGKGVITLDELPESGEVIPDDFPEAGGNFRFIVDEPTAKQARRPHVVALHNPLLNERGEVMAYLTIG